MIFKTIPQNGASWLKPLLYTLEFDQQEEQVEVVIYDQLSSTQLGRVILYNVTSVEIDIAPYIRSFSLGSTLGKQSDVISRSEDACRVVLRAKGVESEPRLFFRSDISGGAPRVLSTIIDSGTVAVGEVIRFTLWAEQSISIVVTKPSEGGIVAYSYNTNGVPCEVAMPINVANEGENIMLRVTCDGVYLGLYKFRVVVRDDSAVRLAWVNSNGGMECYTFPQSVKRSIAVKSEDIESECGWYRRITSSTVVRRLKMIGATQSEVDRVLEVLLSPKVYRCNGWESMAVQLLTDTLTYDDHGRLHRLEFDINEEWKGGGQLWS